MPIKLTFIMDSQKAVRIGFVLLLVQTVLNQQKASRHLAILQTYSKLLALSVISE
jgi:hypothetical protein